MVHHVVDLNWKFVCLGVWFMLKNVFTQKNVDAIDLISISTSFPKYVNWEKRKEKREKKSLFLTNVAPLRPSGVTAKSGPMRPLCTFHCHISPRIDIQTVLRGRRKLILCHCFAKASSKRQSKAYGDANCIGRRRWIALNHAIPHSSRRRLGRTLPAVLKLLPGP